MPVEATCMRGKRSKAAPIDAMLVKFPSLQIWGTRLLTTWFCVGSK
jgi:hypothetical protein